MIDLLCDTLLVVISPFTRKQKPQMATTTKKQEEPAKLIYELSLHGVVNQSSYAQLLTRLDGICGTIVHQHPSLRFKTWETVHITQRTMPQNPSAMVARPPKETIEFRLIHEYDKDQDCWKCKHMKYFGRIAPSTKEKTYKTCTRQVSYGHAFSENVIPFLNAIKCEYVHNIMILASRCMLTTTTTITLDSTMNL